MRAAINAAGDLTASRVLDAGAGTGLLARLIASSDTRPDSMVLVDSSGAMLAQARVRFDANGVADQQLVRAELTDVPFADESFDIAFIVFVLHILEPAQVTSALTELRRLLRPDGRLICVTPLPKRTAMRALMCWATRITSASRWWRLGGLRPMNPTDELVAAGFEIEHTGHISRGYSSLCIRARRRTFDTGESLISEAGQTQHGPCSHRDRWRQRRPCRRAGRRGNRRARGAR